MARKLACSFCGKDEDHVAKLVAGPKVFICDRCIEVASAIVKHGRSGEGAAPSRPLRWAARLWSRLVAAFRTPGRSRFQATA